MIEEPRDFEITRMYVSTFKWFYTIKDVDTDEIWKCLPNNLGKLYKVSIDNTLVPIELAEDEYTCELIYSFFNFAKMKYLESYLGYPIIVSEMVGY